jgi:hypothetical protein
MSSPKKIDLAPKCPLTKPRTARIARREVVETQSPVRAKGPQSICQQHRLNKPKRQQLLRVNQRKLFKSITLSATAVDRTHTTIRKTNKLLRTTSGSL